MEMVKREAKNSDSVSGHRVTNLNLGGIFTDRTELRGHDCYVLPMSKIRG